MTPRTIALAFTGASGLPYGLRLLQCLLDARVRVALVYSPATHIVAKQELDLTLPAQPAAATAFFAERYAAAPDQLRVYGREDWLSPLASGSNTADAMAICPCSMGTLGAIAAGLADNLIERAADVMLKERRTLVLVPRETPFSTIHLDNMLKLSRAGAVIVPPSPGFYGHPSTVDDLVDFVVARILDQLAVPHAIGPRWGEADGRARRRAEGVKSDER